MENICYVRCVTFVFKMWICVYLHACILTWGGVLCIAETQSTTLITSTSHTQRAFLYCWLLPVEGRYFSDRERPRTISIVCLIEKINASALSKSSSNITCSRK